MGCWARSLLLFLGGGLGLFDLGDEGVELVDGVVEGGGAFVDDGDELVALLGDLLERVVLVADDLVLFGDALVLLLDVVVLAGDRLLIRGDLAVEGELGVLGALEVAVEGSDGEGVGLLGDEEFLDAGVEAGDLGLSLLDGVGELDDVLGLGVVGLADGLEVSEEAGLAGPLHDAEG